MQKDWSVFGFYPIVTGSFGVSSRLSMSFYGIFWTNPSFANATSTGTDWFLETSAGLSFNRLSAGKNVTKNSGFPAEFYRLGLFLPIL